MLFCKLMIVIYFVLFNLKRNRVKHWFRNTAEPSYEICIFKSLTCCYWWWFNSTMNCISSWYAGLFWLRTWWVPDSAVFTLARLVTSNSALFRQCVLSSCPLEFHPGSPLVQWRRSGDAPARFCELLDGSQRLLRSQLLALQDRVLGDHLYLLCL